MFSNIEDTFFSEIYMYIDPVSLCRGLEVVPPASRGFVYEGEWMDNKIA